MRTRTIALAGLLALVAGACSLADDEPVPAPTGSAPSSFPTVGPPGLTGSTGSASQQPIAGCTEAKAVDLTDDEAAELEIEDFAYHPACATMANRGKEPKLAVGPNPFHCSIHPEMTGTIFVTG
jgi:hypothetical protein